MPCTYALYHIAYYTYLALIFLVPYCFVQDEYVRGGRRLSLHQRVIKICKEGILCITRDVKSVHFFLVLSPSNFCLEAGSGVRVET